MTAARGCAGVVVDPEAVVEAETHQKGGGDQHPRDQDPEGTEQLEQDRQQGDAEDRLGQPGRGADPAGEKAPAQPDPAHPHRDRDGGEADDGAEVFAEAH